MFFKNLKIKNSFRAISIGLFVFFTLRFQQEIFHVSLGWNKWLEGSVIYHLTWATILTGVAFFGLQNKPSIVQRFSSFKLENKAKIQQIKQFGIKFFSVLLLGILFYYLGVRENQTANFRTIKVELATPVDSTEIWQVYFYTLAGYTAFQRADGALEATEVSLPIHTEEAFTKLRIDPSERRAVRQYEIKKLIFEKNNEPLFELSGKPLFDIIKPNKDFANFTYDEANNTVKLQTTIGRDPYFELGITDKVFATSVLKLDVSWLIKCLLLGTLVFLLLLNHQKIIEAYNRLLKDTNFGTATNFGIALGIGILGFILIQNRGKALPLKLLSVHFEQKPDIPQDLWKTYLNIEGEYSEAFSLNGWSSGKTMFFVIPEGLAFTKLRIDPGITSQNYSLEKVTIGSGLERLKTIKGNELFESITPINQIKDFGISNKKSLVTLQTEEGDPFFELNVSSEDFTDKNNLFEIILTCFLGLLSFILLKYLPVLKRIDWKSKKISQYFLGINLLLLLGNILFLGDWRYLLLLFNLVWLFLLPGKWLQRKSGFKTGFPLGDNLLAVAIGISILLFPLYVFYSLNVPNAHWIAIFFAFCFGLLYLSDEFNDDTKTLYVPRILNLDFLLFNLLFFLFLSPIKDLLCPPLHDPAIIASIANDIIDGGFTKNPIHISNWTYPPYLQLLTAFLAKLSGMITPKVLLFITNLFTFLAGLAFGGMWGQFFKNKYAFWISTMLFLFISPSIPDLYYTAGKNAMIFSFFYWFILLWAGSILMEKKEQFSPYQGLIYAFLLIAGFQFNYITIFIFPFIGIYALIWLYQDLKLGKQLFLRKYKTLLISGLIPGLFFGIFAFYQYKISIENPRFSLFYAEKTVNRADEKIKQQLKKEAQLNKIAIPENEENINNSKEEEDNTLKEENRSKGGKLNSSKGEDIEIKSSAENNVFLTSILDKIDKKCRLYYRYFVNLLEHYSKDYSLFRRPIYSHFTGWLLLILFFWSKRKKEILLVLGFSLLIIYLNQSYIYNLQHYSKILRFVPPLLAGTFLINLVFHQVRNSQFLRTILLIPIAFISIKQMASLTEQYNQIRFNSVLTKYDLEAINFIDKNLAAKGYFMPTNVGNLSQMLPYHGDASLYLGLTKSETAISFIQGKLLIHASEEFNTLKRALLNWQNEKLNSEETLFPLMKKYNINYFYSGAYVPTGRVVELARLENNPKFSLIYENHGVRIYQINYEKILEL